jgi:uncharacterized protein (TIGR02453 family)
MLQASTIKFLKDLKKNNNKPWFDLHRNQYEAAKADFVDFIQLMIDKHGKKDPGISHLKAKECIFRINRDIRFSKDKSPYKTNFGAFINTGGKKSMLAGYYFHLEPGQSFTGGGVWQPMPPALKKLRQEIDYNFKEFQKIITTKKFRSVYGGLSQDDDIRLSRIPKGYDESNPAAGFLKLKSFVAMTELPDTDLTSKTLEKKTLEAYEALSPLVDFLNRGLAD